MLNYPDIDPVALTLGTLNIRWYGISYVIGIIAAMLLLRWRSKRLLKQNYSNDDIDDIIFYGTLGVIVGGRLGSVVFYNFAYYWENPIDILKINQGGMSFHGGLLGVILMMFFWTRYKSVDFFNTMDFIVPVIPIGLGFGRIANFINGELWGKPSTLPWAMVFPDPRAGNVARHPSQLYEALLEGLLLFFILWLYASKPRPVMAISGLFLLIYGIFRCCIEFIREPDQHIGYLEFNWLTMGQLLSLPMIALGFVLIVYAYMRAEN